MTLIYYFIHTYVNSVGCVANFLLQMVQKLGKNHREWQKALQEIIAKCVPAITETAVLPETL